MQKLFLLATFYILSVQLSAQNIQKLSALDYNKDSLETIYGEGKIFIPEYELQSLIALSFYPELQHTKIKFQLADKESTAKTTVTFLSILNTSDKHFIIYINNNKTRTGLTLKDAPFNAQVGAIGHELAHVADFKTKNLLQMGLWGIKYLSRKLKIQIENKTDKSTIQHGLGWQLYDFVDFVLNRSTATEAYKNFKRKNYLSLDEIRNLIKKYYAQYH